MVQFHTAQVQKSELKHDVLMMMMMMLVVSGASPCTRRRGGGGRSEADVLDGADGVEEEAAVELLHQRPMKQLAPHVHHRAVPTHPPPPIPMKQLGRTWASTASCWAESGILLAYYISGW